jgi:HD-GYP domain-containing protein (c-di-GMP phosphodiesterase class II)
LRKNTKLKDEEYAKMKQHPVLGAEILSHIHYLAGALPGIRYHHERYDGCGYPDGIAGNEIPIIARIISVADAYDAMTSERSYHKEMKSKDAAKEIYRCSGTQFDPIVVQAFLDAFCKGEITGQHELMPNASNPAQIVIS